MVLEDRPEHQTEDWLHSDSCESSRSQDVGSPCAGLENGTSMVPRQDSTCHAGFCSGNPHLRRVSGLENPTGLWHLSVSKNPHLWRWGGVPDHGMGLVGGGGRWWSCRCNAMSHCRDRMKLTKSQSQRKLPSSRLHRAVRLVLISGNCRSFQSHLNELLSKLVILHQTTSSTPSSCWELYSQPVCRKIGSLVRSQ